MILKKKINEEEIKINKSKTYLLPLISEVVPLPYKIINKSLLNTYVQDSKGKHKDCIYLYFKYDIVNPDFTKYEHELFNNEYFVESYDINDKVLYVFKFPEEYMNEYNYYKQGIYSKYGMDAKLMILKYLAKLLGSNVHSIPTLKKIKQILNKDNVLRGEMEKELKTRIKDSQELGEAFNSKRETFNLNEIEDDESKN